MSDFGNIGFSGKLRPSQVASSQIIENQLSAGEKKLLVVAPPGSGKTVLGLYVWSDLIRKPTLVLSPNSAIQAQWIARAEELFELDGRGAEIGVNPKDPGILTSLTYQSVTMPSKGGDDLDGVAIDIWKAKLMESDNTGTCQAEDVESAMAWITDLEDKNPEYYSERLGFYRKKARDDLAQHGNALWILHESSKENLRRLSEVGIGLIILDECHHLMEHWGRVLVEMKELFGDPVILGLTATPPDVDSASTSSADMYSEFFGEVDYEVPVPALVRDGNLAPYQDLVYFVRPTQDELRYIANVDDEFNELVDQISLGSGDEKEGRTPPLEVWLAQTLDGLLLPSGQVKDWSSFSRRDPTLSRLAPLYLSRKGFMLPPEVPVPNEIDVEKWNQHDLIPLLDRYIRNGLMRSRSKKDHALADEAKQKLRMLGVQITESGARACSSPVGRVMAYANSKYDALRDVLSAEMQALGPDIRAVVVTDFEKTSATAIVEGVLDKGAGGAVAAYRAILESDSTDVLDPILMTGSTVLVDDDLLERISPRFEKWVKERALAIKFDHIERDGFMEIRGSGEHWKPRYYTMMITELFQEGITKCIIGTRGLLGEGWDASRINVLIDLTTVTTSMSINQLRGRSFRLDKEWPEKVANNWDIVCLAEEFSKGFDDYDRFKQKHRQLYGVCDDGAIEKGVGHVHAAFTEVRPEGISENLEVFNEEMIRRAGDRSSSRNLWNVGVPFNAVPKEALEMKTGGLAQGFPPVRNIGSAQWTDESLIMAIADAVASSLMEVGEISPVASRVAGGSRSGGWFRTYLEGSSEKDSEVFAKAMQEVLGPLDNPRYIISRDVRHITDNWLSTLLPEVLAKYFRGTKSELVMFHAIPRLLSRDKERVAVFRRRWNLKVSPGEVIYGHSQSGKERIDLVKRAGYSPPSINFHRKSVFV